MTAEVAILNRQAVAMAADSAVTVSGPGGPKIFNTVNKLFALSKYHPVGIMVYSSAQVMGVPVETVIKNYRRKLGTASFDTIEMYRDHFYQYLTDDTNVFTENARIENGFNILNNLLSHIKSQIYTMLNSSYTGWGYPTLDQARDTAKNILQSICQQYNSSNELSNVTADIKSKILTDFSNITTAWKQLFKSEFDLDDTDIACLDNLAVNVLLHDIRCRRETGFVIAGFGEKEIFPQLRSFEFESSIYGIHKSYEGLSADMTKNTSQIAPFAQKEMVETFVQGRASSLDGFLDMFISNFFEEEKTKSLSLPDSKNTIDFLDRINTDLRREFVTKLRDFTRSSHIEPLVQTVANMPKEELAIMAEALINLTAIKRRMSPDAETVGGPTDVAIISKGDGFVWIKRKHYFDGAINRQFEYNYNREDNDHEDTR